MDQLVRHEYTFDHPKELAKAHEFFTHAGFFNREIHLVLTEQETSCKLIMWLPKGESLTFDDLLEFSDGI
jgi:hypothetical protein